MSWPFYRGKPPAQSKTFTRLTKSLPLTGLLRKSRVQATHPVLDARCKLMGLPGIPLNATLGGEHEHGYLGGVHIAFQATHDLVTIHHGHHDIEDDEVRMRNRGCWPARSAFR